MRVPHSVLLGVAIAVGLAAGHAGSRLIAIEMGPRALSGLEWTDRAPDGSVPAGTSVAPFELRLVDAGGVGIPADTAAWGTSYSHATYAFDRIILDRAPWVDEAELAAIREDWRPYVARMAGYGNNAVVLDAFLEMINFDRVGDGTEVYGRTDPLRQRHVALRAAFGSLVADARAVGLGVYLKTDLPVLSAELEAYLERTSGLDASDPAFWAVYAAGLEELFTTMPDLDGVVVRVGEAGPLFNAAGSSYRSYMGVREPEQLRLMLRTVLPVFERHGKRMIFRNWSVGVGALGHLHDDPDVYLRVLGDIESPALVVSTKFVKGDYFGFLALNPTLAVGPHRRIVEFQARREFEGFGALPNYLADAHRRALLQLRAANPNLIGISLWAQEGGPLRAGPLSLYTTAGFWTWADANVYATTRLALDPRADPRALAEDWARATVSTDPEVVDGLADVLMDSRRALEQAVYIRPFARQTVGIAGIEVPPILWIFEWDVIGGWSSVQSTLYSALRGHEDEAVAEGFAAVELTRSMRSRLADLGPKLAGHPDGPAMARSLAYQESLYETLAWYRAWFIGYYSWLDRGGAPTWRDASDRFLAAAADHQARFGRDLDFPAFDFAPAVATVERARGGLPIRLAARAVAVLVALIALRAALARRRQGAAPAFSRRARETAAVLLSAATAALLLPAAAPLLPLGTAVLLASFVGALWWSWQGPGLDGRSAVAAPAVLAPWAWAALPVLAALTVRGPDFFWLRFWSEGWFRAAALGLPAAAALATLVSAYALGRRVGERHAFALGSLAIAGGVGLMVLTGLLPDLTTILVALDEPLHLLPMRPAIINGITHYAGVPAWTSWVPAATGVVMIGAGMVLRRRGGPPRPPLAHRGRGVTIASPGARRALS